MAEGLESAAPGDGETSSAVPAATGPEAGESIQPGSPAPASPADASIPTERVPIGDAMKLLGESESGKWLINEWGVSAEENLGYARGEADSILQDLASHDPGAARALLDAVNNFSDHQLAGLLRTLAARGRERWESPAPTPAPFTPTKEGESHMPDIKGMSQRQQIEARVNRIHGWQHSQNFEERAAYAHEATQRELKGLYAQLYGDAAAVGTRGSGEHGTQRTY